MIILSIETSCDDTSIAIFRDNKQIFCATKSQIKIHNETWWVVPEVAARAHWSIILEVLDEVLEESKISLENIDYIAVTNTPWLQSSLLTWTSLAWTLSFVLQKPVLPINHIEAHIMANFLDREEDEITFPLACLTVSWGHNEVYYMKDKFDYERVWSTLDDAAWEAFDKVAKMLWLWYPWWPIVSKMSQDYEKKTWKKNWELFPRVWLKKKEFDFSFSGLKSAVKREIDLRIEENLRLNKGSYNKVEWLTLDDIQEICFEFECWVVEVLAYKLINLAKINGLKTVMLAWWVSANSRLKDYILAKTREEWLEFIYPKKLSYCWDNALMIWITAYFRIKNWLDTPKVWAVWV